VVTIVTVGSARAPWRGYAEAMATHVRELPPDQQTAHESVRSEADVGRFSRGVERRAENDQKLHRGRFSEGMEHLGQTARKRHPGRFSDGLEELPETPRKLHRGNFAEGMERTPHE
jgi:hypothetical protein